MASITSVNASISLTVASLVGATVLPQVNLSGFSTDDIYSTTPVALKEIQMGLDGRLSAGRIFQPIEMTISLQADSPSIPWFDAWNALELAIADTYWCNGSVWLNSLARKWTLNTGTLHNYQALPDAGRVLKPRRFTITFESVSPAAI